MNIVAKYYFSRTGPGEPHVAELWLTAFETLSGGTEHLYDYDIRYEHDDGSVCFLGEFSALKEVPSYADVFERLPKDERGRFAPPEAGGAA